MERIRDPAVMTLHHLFSAAYIVVSAACEPEGREFSVIVILLVKVLAPFLHFPS